MTDEATVERVARAIIACRHADDDMPADDVPTTDYDRDMARAAIAALPPQVSPELIEKLGRLATYLTEQGEYEACDLIDTVVERVTKPALSPQGDGLAELRALSERATPGEWVIWGLKSSHGHLTIGIETETGPTKHVCEMSWGRDSHERGASGGEDAAFIVACVNHVRAEIERTKP